MGLSPPSRTRCTSTTSLACSGSKDRVNPSAGGMTVTSASAGTLDEAYERLHATGPEFDGFLSNHGPMVAEAMARRGQADGVQRWLDFYVQRLEEFPRGISPIGAQWREALGDPHRVADWTTHFRAEVAG